MLARIPHLLLLIVCLGLLGCGDAEDVTREGPRTAEDEAAIRALDEEIDNAESGEQ